MIDPRIDPAGEGYADYNRRRWGSDGWTHSLRAAGAPDGALFAKWDWWPNTLHAHRLMALASRHGKGRHAKEALFRLACVGGPRARGRWSASAATARQATAVRPPHPPLRSYEEGQNLSDLEVLVAAGRHLGLPDVESYLQGDCGRAEVLADDAHGKRE